MTKTQEALIELASFLDNVCKKNGITYYLAGGGLIGSLRNGGFLPWDDDLDIHIFIEDALKLKNIINNEYSPRYEVYSGEEDNEWNITHWRLLDNSKSTMFKSGVGSSMPQGLFVDFFVLYYLPNDEKMVQKCVDDLNLYVELKARNTIVKSSRDKSFLDRYHEVMGKTNMQEYSRALKALRDEMYYYDDTISDNCLIVSPDAPQRVANIGLFGTPRYVKFETIMLPIPQYAEVFLDYVYGTTWYEVPEAHEREKHQFIEDIDVPYSFYTRYSKDHLDVNEFYEKQVEKKQKWFEIIYERNYVNPKINELKGRKIVQKIVSYVQKNEIDLLDMIRCNKVSALEAIFESYFDYIKSDSSKYWGNYVELPDEYLYAALYYKCIAGEYRLPYKLLSRQKLCNEKISDCLESLLTMCEYIDILLKEIYTLKNYDKARRLLDVCLKKYEGCIYFYRADILLKIDEQMNFEDLLLLCNEYLKKYPEDGELLKYKGDILKRLKKTEWSNKVYRMAKCKTNNGLYLKEINEFLL